MVVSLEQIKHEILVRLILLHISKIVNINFQ